MQQFEVGDHVEAISDAYKSEGMRLGQRGRVVEVIADSAPFGQALYDVQADIANDPDEPFTIWCFYDNELKLVHENDI